MTRSLLSLIVGLALLGTSSCNRASSGVESLGDTVVFVGASITSHWDFDHYFPGRDFRKVKHYDADKTQAWRAVERENPRIVVVKECAAYFENRGGTPIGEYGLIMERMVALIRDAGATPVLATTVPVDIGYGGNTAVKLAEIMAFNDWIRSYCAAEGIVCMELAGAVADAQGQLPTAFHDGDGLHPNAAGYDRMSTVVIPALERAGL